MDTWSQYGLVWFGLVLCCLMTPGSVRTFGVMHDHTLSQLANQQVRHQATHKLRCQPGDCIYGPFSISKGLVWICMG